MLARIASFAVVTGRLQRSSKKQLRCSEKAVTSDQCPVFSEEKKKSMTAARRNLHLFSFKKLL
jgi:hypothetical protein